MEHLFNYDSITTTTTSTTTTTTTTISITISITTMAIITKSTMWRSLMTRVTRSFPCGAGVLVERYDINANRFLRQLFFKISDLSFFYDIICCSNSPCKLGNLG